MRPSIPLILTLLLLGAAEAQAQFPSGPEATRIRMALALVVFLALVLLIRRGAPRRGSRRWFWESSAEEIGPSLAEIRGRLLIPIVLGISMTLFGLISGGYRVGNALADAFDQGGTFLAHLGPGGFLSGVLVVAGIALAGWGFSRTPKDL